MVYIRYINSNTVRADVGRPGGSAEGGAGDVSRAAQDRAEAPGVAVSGVLATQGLRNHPGRLGGPVVDPIADQLRHA